MNANKESIFVDSKRFVMCLDGTWNNTYAENEREDGSKVIKPSNVLKLARAVLPRASDGREQIVYYDTGVGAMSEYPGPSNKMLQYFDKILGGGWGAGFESNIDDAVTFLAHNYMQGDQVYVFGFSRGASSARALSQFIEWMGGLPVKRDSYYIPVFLRRYVESSGKVTAKQVVDKINKRLDKDTAGKQQLNPFHEISIEFLGVWDSVMALGSKLFTSAHRRYHISDTPASCINHVRHALAIDEKRADFKPEIWTGAHSGQSLVQLWFAGVHSNIGGGYVNDGLANVSFKWMVSEASNYGLEFDTRFLGYYRPYVYDKLTESKTLKYRVLDAMRLRNGLRSLMDHPASANLDLHYSVISRIKADAQEIVPGSRKPRYPRLKQYEPDNIFEYLASKDNLNDYISRISLRDRNKVPATELSQQVLDRISHLKRK
ncbi:MAG: DUF2235 domain-containing protein [Gammaproteobacteria bacterium]